MTAKIEPGAGDVLLVVDLQNDFCPQGALAVAGGDAVVPIANRLAARFDSVVLTQDWHPPGHSSFASVHPGKNPYDTIELPYGEQTLWPDHCVRDTHGAAFHADLDMPQAELVIRKGFRPDIDSYSAFFENDHATPTGLIGYLRERGFSRLFICGLALDFCVRFSAEDAARAGFDVVVIEDACRPVDLPGTVEAAVAGMREHGVTVIDSGAVAG